MTLLERLDRLGGAVGSLEQDGYRWDTGPTYTALPAVLRDLFRKSGRPLERELELVPVEPMRRHRFEDGVVLDLPSGSRAGQLDAVDAALGGGAGRAWVDYVHSFADSWDVLRRGYLERPWSPEHADREVRDLLRSRATQQRTVRKTFRDERLRALALTHAVVDGHDPRNVPAWMGLVDYVEQNFGTWTVPGGLGQLAGTLTRRLAERRVEVLLGTAARDLVLRDGRVVAVDTVSGPVDADVVVCAVDPRGLPALAGFVGRTMPALPPTMCHLGLEGDLPDLPHEVVLHGDPTLVVRTAGATGPTDPTDAAGPADGAAGGRAAWTVLARGRLAEDVLVALARRGLDVRGQVRTRVDRSPASWRSPGAARRTACCGRAAPRWPSGWAPRRRCPGCTRSGRTWPAAPGCRSSA
ncbi:phytoene desaturase family protein [Nocardioides mesophilus]|uniref:phytoene desaturase family protein n=1 Tax=Nocardioides mesophilus TaxID=433659 RepID=UPI001FEC05B5|nr:FAD-dependent oxidoreductase [Nocardioides mesophilus]